MIRQLTQADAPLLEAFQPVDANGCRIRALYRAYGLQYDFVRFFANEDQSILLCLEDGFATVCCTKEGAAEAAAFLSLTAGEVLSELPLPLEGFSGESGNAYAGQPLAPERIEGIKTDISTAYPLLTESFHGMIPEGKYPLWYADFSHRLRHGVSKVYTLPGIVTGSVYGVENGQLLLCQLGVSQKERGGGWARRMIAHICGENPSAARLLLHSRNGDSDRFYRHLGFEKTGQWYYYSRQTEADSPV